MQRTKNELDRDTTCPGFAADDTGITSSIFTRAAPGRMAATEGEADHHKDEPFSQIIARRLHGEAGPLFADRESGS